MSGGGGWGMSYTPEDHFTYRVDPDEMSHFVAFIWVLTACKSTPIQGAISIQRINIVKLIEPVHKTLVQK